MQLHATAFSVCLCYVTDHKIVRYHGEDRVARTLRDRMAEAARAPVDATISSEIPTPAITGPGSPQSFPDPAILSPTEPDTEGAAAAAAGGNATGVVSTLFAMAPPEPQSEGHLLPCSTPPPEVPLVVVASRKVAAVVDELAKLNESRDRAISQASANRDAIVAAANEVLAKTQETILAAAEVKQAALNIELATAKAALSGATNTTSALIEVSSGVLRCHCNILNLLYPLCAVFVRLQLGSMTRTSSRTRPRS